MTSPADVVSAVEALHGEIMNLRCVVPDEIHIYAPVMAYKVGHRDARHAAAELASAVASLCAVAPPVDDLFTLRGWISVSERLPGDEWLQAAVYRASDGEIDFAHWDSTEGRFDSYIGDIGSDVTHWMPLPAPPEANRGAPAGATAQTPPKDQS